MKKFIKKIEDFVCAHCKKSVVGNGYTNHCPHCLWSRHVDVHPGDRGSHCEGMMKPIGIEIRKKVTLILFRCEICGHRRPNKISAQDNSQAIIDISVITS